MYVYYVIIILYIFIYIYIENYTVIRNFRNFFEQNKCIERGEIEKYYCAEMNI